MILKFAKALGVTLFDLFNYNGPLPGTISWIGYKIAKLAVYPYTYYSYRCFNAESSCQP